jgi:hypothetical protein
VNHNFRVHVSILMGVLILLFFVIFGINIKMTVKFYKGMAVTNQTYEIENLTFN